MWASSENTASSALLSPVYCQSRLQILGTWFDVWFFYWGVSRWRCVCVGSWQWASVWRTTKQFNLSRGPEWRQGDPQLSGQSESNCLLQVGNTHTHTCTDCIYVHVSDSVLLSFFSSSFHVNESFHNWDFPRYMSPALTQICSNQVTIVHVISVPSYRCNLISLSTLVTFGCKHTD